MSDASDDNVLKDVELGAWEAPEPPDDLADSVIARLGGTEVGAAVPVEEPAQRNRGLVIGGVAAAVLAVTLGGYALVRNARHAAPSDGSVVAEHARTLALDGAHADLDPGTEVTWRRTGSTLRVEQRRGTAAWRVDDDQTLVIDAGAMVASVEATGSASLRVEVKMNATDARIIGATAITSAAVAMVTVVVYEGHVKVHSGSPQQTVVVEPGRTYTVTPPAPDIPAEPPVVGVGPVPRTVVTVAPANCDEVSCVLSNYDGACCAKFKAHPTVSNVPDALGRKEISATILGLRAQVEACGATSPAHGLLKIHVKVDPSGGVASSEITKGVEPDVDACVQKVVASAVFPETRQGGSFSYPFVFSGASTPPVQCDAQALKDKGMEDVNVGKHAAALAQFEKSLACKQDSYVVALAFMAACNAQDAPKARQYYQQLSVAERSKLKVMCDRNHVDLDAGSASPAGPHGYLQLKTLPAAKVLVDGADTGLTTPVSRLPLAPGWHRITFVIASPGSAGADERFTYPVTVRDGETLTLSKDLQ